MCVKQSRSPFHCGPFTAWSFNPALLLGRSLFRSYGASLPSSLTKVISRTLVFSTRPPVSVYGTVMTETPCEDFLGSVTGQLQRIAPPRLGFRLSRQRGFSCAVWTFPFPRDNLYPVCLISCVPPQVMTRPPQFRNINRMSIAYAFRPRLRPD